MSKRVGFCCKWIDHEGQINGIGLKEQARELSARSVTLTWMQKNAGSVANSRLEEVVEHNLRSLELLINKVSSRNEIFHMVRMGSDILPLYSIPYWKETFYNQPQIFKKLENGFGKVGELARKNNIRLSFHPGEFTVLASLDPKIVINSIDEIEYHADMARLMGYGYEFQDMKINVHISGRKGAEGILEVLPKLSQTALNCLTIENDEMSWGIDESLKLKNHVALVLDIHHHWVRTGEYIQPDDPRVLEIVESWRGVKPVIHYSQPKKSLFPDHDPNVLIDGSNISKTKLRGHSDFYWNQACNEWAWSFSDMFDIQTESKAKNLSQELFVNQMLVPVC